MLVHLLHCTLKRGQNRSSLIVFSRRQLANSWITVLRENLAVDRCDLAGVYVGTSTGQLFYSRDEGDCWELLADYLPAIASVNATRIVG